MNLWWLVVAGVGLVVVTLSSLAARKPYIGSVESRLFHAVNGLPDWLYPLLWLPMQLGNLVVGTAAGLVVALVDGDVTVAIGVVLAMGLKLVVERVVRKEMADYLTVRQRPGTSEVGAVLRGGDVPVSGPSFPSGHVILVAAVGSVVAAERPAGVVVGPGRPHRAGDARSRVRRARTTRSTSRPASEPASSSADWLPSS